MNLRRALSAESYFYFTKFRSKSRHHACCKISLQYSFALKKKPILKNVNKKKLKEGFEMITCLWQEIIQKIICNNSKHCRLIENEENA